MYPQRTLILTITVAGNEDVWRLYEVKGVGVLRFHWFKVLDSGEERRVNTHATTATALSYLGTIHVR
jgi:hypothetical protein